MKFELYNTKTSAILSRPFDFRKDADTACASYNESAGSDIAGVRESETPLPRTVHPDADNELRGNFYIDRVEFALPGLVRKVERYSTHWKKESVEAEFASITKANPNMRFMLLDAEFNVIGDTHPGSTV